MFDKHSASKQGYRLTFWPHYFFSFVFLINFRTNLWDLRQHINEAQLRTLLSLPNYDIYIYAFSRRFYPKRLTVHSGYTFFFYQYVCSLGIEPTTFCTANAMLYLWATGTLWLSGMTEQCICPLGIRWINMSEERKHSFFKSRLIDFSVSVLVSWVGAVF